MRTLICSTPRFDVIETTSDDPRYASDFHLQKPDGVSIAAILDDCVLLLEVKRRWSLEPTFEFPGGRVELGEDPLDAAKRELFEETGLSLTEFKEIGIVYPLPGYVSEKVSLYTVQLLKHHLNLIETSYSFEGIIGHKIVTAASLDKFCSDGEISSAVDAYFAMLIHNNLRK